MKKELFATVKTEGALLPADLLVRVSSEDKTLPGLTSDHYHLARNERLNEAVTRAWNRLRGAWSSFREDLDRLSEEDPGTGVTRDRWLNILFQELGFGRLSPARDLVIEGKNYPISHLWERVPIHLLGAGVSLDRRARGVAGAAVSSPHSLVQEFLNRSDDHLWAIVTNGKTLRVLRDNLSLTRQAYLEFDLFAMLEGELYADFKLLWLICHESRLEGDRPEECWLEQWSRQAAKDGTRALDDLRRGVEGAIEALGRGFLQHPANQTLRRSLEEGRLDRQDYYRQVLRLVYRLLFLFVAEDRGLLLDPDAPGELRERYLDYYSTARLRWLASRRRGTRHADLWQALRVVMRHLGSDTGCPGLALYPLGGFLWSEGALPALTGSELANQDLLEAIRKLSYTFDKNVPRPVDYKNMGTEELGSVYESLLELTPELNQTAGSFKLVSLSGNERKSTGSYYTPPELVQTLLDSALEPVVKERLAEARKTGRGLAGEALAEHLSGALLSLTVCDPACGSGHFLLAAAHRLAHHLASVRSGDAEPAPEAMRRALRDVIGHCIYGVDINPMAVELCKVNLWIECLEPTRPLSFLENKILCGNSLLGVTPELMKAGVPDEAFVALLGDDKKHVTALKKKNAQERKGYVQGQLAFGAQAAPSTSEGEVRALEAVADDRIDGIHRKEEMFARWQADPARVREKLTCDAWCAAFVVSKRPDQPSLTQETVLALGTGEPAPAGVRELVEKAAADYGFFHWHLAFPSVFSDGGFTLVLGNPPWERLKIQEKEWFASRSRYVAEAKTAAERSRRIADLRTSDPALFEAFQEDLRRSEGESHFLHNSGRYPLCGRGDINTYAVFAETNRMLMNEVGQFGCIIPSGVATDHTTQHFFADLIETRTIRSLYDFENAVGYFPGVGHGRFKFCLLTLTGRGRPIDQADFVWYAHRTTDLDESHRHFGLTREELERLNPNTSNCPIFRSRRDADLNIAVYRRVPVLWREGPQEANPWKLSFLRMLDTANDSGLFRDAPALEADGYHLVASRFERGGDVYLPLFEAKMLWHYQHRYGDYRDYPPGAQTTSLPFVPTERLEDPEYMPLPRYWVPLREVEARLAGRTDRNWLLGWRDITNTTNERTVIASLLPRVGVADTFLLGIPDVEPALTACLYSNLCSFVLDYCARQKVGGTHLKYHVFKQLPVLPPDTYARPCPWSPCQTLAEWIVPSVLELTYTARDLRAFAEDLGHVGPPFSWNDERRFMLRCQLDAAYFHLYGLAREDVSYVMDTFPILRKSDEKNHGDYRTKERVLCIFDEMRVGME